MRPLARLPRTGLPHTGRLRRVRGRTIFPLAALALATACGPDAPPPDRILLNGLIWTGDSARPAATAIALRGDSIVAVGFDADIEALAGEATRVENLEGRRVVPGFHDAHWHLPTRRTADLTGAPNVDSLVSRLRAFAATLPDSAWITGRGWTPDMFPANTATSAALDLAFPDRPVLLTDRDGHQSLANRVALRLAGIDRSSVAPPGGAIDRARDGTPTGLLRETAAAPVRERIPPPSADEVYSALQETMAAAARDGLTALQIANGLNEAEEEAFARALAEGTLRTRFRIAVPFVPLPSDSAMSEWTARRDRDRGPLLRHGIAKGMLDGTVDARSAAMLAPYAVGGGTGLPRWSLDTLVETLARYDSAGLQVELHAIGDAAIRQALDAYEAVARRNGPRDRRHRIEHLEVPDPADIPRFKALGVIASTQAVFATPDATALQNYVPLLGPERAARAMPFKALDDAGAVQAFGSDYPVFPMSPILGMQMAVFRQLADGTPEGGWEPQHRISVEAALRHYTRDAAYAAFREREIGILAPGMLADLVVLSDDILDGTLATFTLARPVLTIMGGRDTYRDPALR
jgi:predicted amidohydrolase YtcJ